MKLCFECSEYPPGTHGGLGSLVQILARALAKAGHQVRVVGLYDAGYAAPDYEEDQGVSVWRLRVPPGRWGWVSARRSLFRLVRGWCISGDVELIEVPDFGAPAAGWQSLPVPVIVRLSGSASFFRSEMGRQPRWLTYRLERASIRRGDFILSSSRYIGARTRAVFGIRSEPDAVIYNPVDLPDLRTGTRRDPNSVFFAGTLAEKKGVAVEEAGVDSIPEFYELYRATSQRDKIALHPEGYYRRLFSLSRERMGQGEVRVPEIRLWLARHEGRSLAGIITVFYGETAVYLYGASSDEKRNLMPAYALQWAAMRAAKAAGCTRYDFFGIPPTADPEHPMAGLYRFKTGFGGEIAHRAGSWDYPLLSLSYACFRVAESARTWWFKDFKKRLKRTKKA